jgi:predicted ester cyclase
MPDNKMIVRNYIDRVWNQHDYTAIDENVSPGYIQHSPNVPPGPEGVKAFFQMIESAFSDVRFTVEDMIAEADKVVWRWTIEGKHTGNFRGLAPTGKNFRLTGISILRLENGKFAENWVEQDMAGLLGQLRD